MGIQTEIYLRGKLNNLIFYNSGGQNLVRSMPARIKQTGNTRTRSRNFGLAATAGRVLRSHLEKVLPFPKDKKMQSRFSGAISRWLGISDVASLLPQTPEALTSFSFNTQVAFAERCRIPFTINKQADELQIALPEFIPAEAFAAPVGTQQVQLSFSLAGCGLLQTGLDKGAMKQLALPYNHQLQPAQTLTLPALTERGTLVVLVAALRFMNEQGKVDKRKGFLPAAVLWPAYY
jgi:hypothetical protein